MGFEPLRRCRVRPLPWALPRILREPELFLVGTGLPGMCIFLGRHTGPGGIMPDPFGTVWPNAQSLTLAERLSDV